MERPPERDRNKGLDEEPPQNTHERRPGIRYGPQHRCEILCFLRYSYPYHPLRRGRVKSLLRKNEGHYEKRRGKNERHYEKMRGELLRPSGSVRLALP